MLREKFAQVCELAAQYKARLDEWEAAWEAWAEAVLAGEDAGEQPEAVPFEDPANVSCLLMASAITPGAAEAYGWRRYWLLLAVSESQLADEERAQRYARRWARQRGLVFEGLMWVAPTWACDLPSSHLHIPPRFDSSAG